jgi:hypothetical protein
LWTGAKIKGVLLPKDSNDLYYFKTGKFYKNQLADGNVHNMTDTVIDNIPYGRFGISYKVKDSAATTNEV